jgi:exosortase A
LRPFIYGNASAIRGPLFVAAILASLAGIFWPTVRELLGLGTRSDGRLALVGCAFLAIVWSQRAELARLPLRPFWPGLLGLAPLALVWLVGELALVQVLSDAAVIAMIPVTVLAVLGPRWVSTMAFPLGFLIFAVPLERPFVPALANWTAEFTIMGLRAFAVPVSREGAYFAIPTGNWSVADACSGIEYLASCLMLGALYAWALFRSARKRIIFAAGALVIGIVGNWLRAFSTVMIAHLSENRLLRDDHSTFGWVLYAVLMLICCAIGWRFRDAAPGGAALPSTAPSAGEGSARRSCAFAAAALAVLALAPLIDTALAQTPSARAQMPSTRAIEVADIAPQRSWTRVAQPSVEWKPELNNPYRQRVQSFEKDGRRIDVFTGIFRHQSRNSKLVSTLNQLVDSDRHDWALSERGAAATTFAGRPLEVATGAIVGRGSRLVAWHWYWVDGVATASGSRAKLAQLLVRLRGEDDSAAWVAIYTEANRSPEAARSALEAFMREMGAPLERALVVTTRPPGGVAKR